MRTVCGSEYQTDGAENRKARLEKYVFVSGCSSSGMAGERRVRLQTHSAMPRVGSGVVRMDPLRFLAGCLQGD